MTFNNLTPTRLGAGAFVLGVLVLSPASVQAAAIAEANIYLSTMAPKDFSTSNSVKSFAALLHSQSLDPPTKIAIDAAASGFADGNFGVVRSSATLYTYQSPGVGPTAINGFANEIAGGGAALTDTIHWTGQTPLTFLLDLDWSVLSANYTEFGGLFGDVSEDASAQAMLSFALTIDGIGNAPIIRGFSYFRNQFFMGEITFWNLSNGQNSIAGGSSISNFIHELVLDPQLVGGQPTPLQIRLEVGTGVSCYIEPVQDATQVCQTQAVAANSGYLQLTGDYASENGYSYLGRNGEPGPTEVPEPSTLSLFGASLALLAAVLLSLKRSTTP